MKYSLPENEVDQMIAPQNVAEAGEQLFSEKMTHLETLYQNEVESSASDSSRTML